MIKVAISGLIGAGKSTATDVFKTLGIRCYNSDVMAKTLMKNKLRPEIELILGNASFLHDGELNRDYIAGKIFSDESLRLKLNSIVHPAVKEDFIRWSEMQNSPYSIIETALLQESGIIDIVDKVILVTADEEERVQRTIQRDNTDKESVRRRIKAQTIQSRLLDSADYIIDNSENRLIIPQILEIHKIILSLCSNKK